MTGTLVAACVLVALLMFAFFGVIGAIGKFRDQEEHDRIKKELENEIFNGGNLARIASLRKRMLELEDDGCRRK